MPFLRHSIEQGWFDRIFRIAFGPILVKTFTVEHGEKQL